MNGQDGRDGAPWCFLLRMIPKNIMLAAYRNPMSAEELAIEMGIALPYMNIQGQQSTICGFSRQKLSYEYFERVNIEEWLKCLHETRNNSPRTCNVRLASLRAFLKYLGEKNAV